MTTLGGLTQAERLLAYPCAVCGIEWPSPLARAAHEGRKHGGSGLTEEALRQRRLETQRRWREAHPDTEIEVGQRYRAKHPHRSRDYLRANPDKAAEFRRRYRAKVAGTPRLAEYRRRDWQSGAHDARRAVRRALVAGRLRREPCLRCARLPVEAHHPNGYSREHQLDILWLCKQHHEDAHHLGLES